ncbi:MAG: hypothetical protein ABIQ72_00295 [Usitatibacter sp.]
MNHNTWNSAAARVIAASFLLAGVTACGDRIADTTAKTPDPVAPSSSTVVVGTPAAPPTGDPPGTTPVAPNTTELTKSVESSAGPQPGQANDHSNVAAKPSQKAGEIAKTPEEGKQANK